LLNTNLKKKRICGVLLILSSKRSASTARGLAAMVSKTHSKTVLAAAAAAGLLLLGLLLLFPPSAATAPRAAALARIAKSAGKNPELSRNV
jgi:hypothetical protein